MTPGTFFGLVRPFTLLGPAVGSLAGAAVAYGAHAGPWQWGPVSFGVLSALLATGASNAWNQAFDAPIDRVNKPNRPVPSGAATEAQAKGVGHLLALGTLVTGALSSWVFLACVSAGLLATWIYSAPPLRTKARPIGALATIALARGVLVPVAGWSLIAAPVTSDPWVLGLLCGTFIFGAAATKDFADIEGDRAHGCRTLPVLLGPVRAAKWIAPFLWLPFLGYPVAGALGGLLAPVEALAVLGAVLATVGFTAARSLLRDPADLAARGENHPAWKAMYLLFLGMHLGAALVYQFVFIGGTVE